MKKSDINILIVEDDPANREVLGAYITKSGYRPVLAAKADEAESVVKIKPIHAALIDCMLPKVNGIDLALRIKDKFTDNAPILLFSGVFQDRGFAADAMKKTGAVEFLSKPLDLDKISKILDEKLKSLTDVPKVALHSLLSKPFASNRDRRKALDHVEQILGFDLPFVFCILMDAEASGHLNIVNETGEIFGVTIAQGKIIEVDSSETDATTALLLLQNGYIKAEELEEAGKEIKKGDLMKNLIAQNYISPHIKIIIKTEQMNRAITRLITKEVVQMNFVPDRRIEVDTPNFDLEAITPILSNLIDSKIDLDWFKAFYSGWLEHPIRLGPKFTEAHNIINLPVMAKISSLFKDVKAEPTLSELLSDNKHNELDLYKAIHVMAIRRAIVFDDVKKQQNTNELKNRLTQLFDNLKGKDPVAIFNYFGVDSEAKPAEVTKIYKDFAKSNHPDKLPQGTSEEVKKLNHQVFSLITDAHETLTNDSKRKKFFSGLKEKEAEMQIRAEEIIEQAVVKLRRGDVKKALIEIKEAYDIHKSPMNEIYLIWATLRAKNLITDVEKNNMTQKFEAVSPEDKKGVVYLFVHGLFMKSTGRTEEAKKLFNKALEVNGGFIDARRELASISKPKSKATDLLTGDVTAIIGNFFKRSK